MATLTTEQVESAATSLIARASTAIDTLEQRKSFLGGFTGNNDTVNSTQGALKMIRDSQIPPWRSSGIQIAINEDATKVNAWCNAGQAFATAITEIDGYGQDATLASVVRNTAEATAETVKEKVVPTLALGFGITAALALVAVGILIYAKAKA